MGEVKTDDLVGGKGDSSDSDDLQSGGGSNGDSTRGGRSEHHVVGPDHTSGLNGSGSISNSSHDGDVVGVSVVVKSNPER